MNSLSGFFNFIPNILLLTHITSYQVQITFFLHEKANSNFINYLSFCLSHPINGLKLIETVFRQKMFELGHLRSF